MQRKTFPSLAALALVVLAAPLLAQNYGLFQLSGDFLLEVDGQVVQDAQIYRSTAQPAVLVRTDRFDAPLLVVPGTQQVQTVNVMKMSRAGDDGLQLLPGAALRPLGGFRIDGESINFAFDDASVSLKPKPPLLGWHEAADLKEYSARYDKGSESYRPVSSVMTRLKNQSRPVKVRVYFGSWCPRCQVTVPGMVRVADDLSGGKYDFEFYGLPQGFGDEPEAKKAKVNGVPTAIVYVGGKEVGRLTNEEWETPERGLSRILSGS
jgi:thiol-disulfide isomerase/thioredoxin